MITLQPFIDIIDMLMLNVSLHFTILDIRVPILNDCVDALAETLTLMSPILSSPAKYTT